MSGRFRPDELLAVVADHGVRFVLIGGLAATIHGSSQVTFDVDLSPERSLENLARLSEALTDLDARVRVDGIDDGLPFDHDAAALSRMGLLNLTTRLGDLDLAFIATGIGGFDEWDAKAVDIVAMGVPVRLAALADVIESKAAADRPKDRAALPVLRELAARQARVNNP